MITVVDKKGITVEKLKEFLKDKPNNLIIKIGIFNNEKYIQTNLTLMDDLQTTIHLEGEYHD